MGWYQKIQRAFQRGDSAPRKSFEGVKETEEQRQKRIAEALAQADKTDKILERSRAKLIGLRRVEKILNEQIENLRKRDNQSLRTQEELELEGGFYKLFDKWQKQLHCSIPREQYPLIEIIPKGKTAVGGSYYDPATNTLKIYEPDMERKGLGLGAIIGEEGGHFFRKQLKRTSLLTRILYKEPPLEKTTEEFFGFLGRRLLYDYAKAQGKETKFFESGDPVKSYPSRKEVVGTLKKIRKRLQNEETPLAERTRLENDRRSILEHHRGYQFAMQVDMTKIDNWEKLFTLSDKEVRRRFFRPDPDYSGLQLEKKEQPYKRSLEHYVGSVGGIIMGSIILLGIMIPLTTPTGNVIASLEKVSVIEIISGLLLIGGMGCGIYYLLQKNNKHDMSSRKSHSLT